MYETGAVGVTVYQVLRGAVKMLVPCKRRNYIQQCTWCAMKAHLVSEVLCEMASFLGIFFDELCYQQFYQYGHMTDGHSSVITWEVSERDDNAVD